MIEENLNGKVVWPFDYLRFFFFFAVLANNYRAFVSDCLICQCSAVSPILQPPLLTLLNIFRLFCSDFSPFRFVIAAKNCFQRLFFPIYFNSIVEEERALKIDNSRRKWRFSQLPALWKCSVERVDLSVDNVSSARKTLFDIVASRFFFGKLPSASHEIYDFSISAFVQRELFDLGNFFVSFRKINSSERHKQFKFLIFTLKCSVWERDL